MSLRSHFTNGLLRTNNRSTSIFHEVNVTLTIAIAPGETPRVKPEVRRKGEAATLFGRLMSSDGVRLVKAVCQVVSRLSLYRARLLLSAGKSVLTGLFWCMPSTSVLLDLPGLINDLDLQQRCFRTSLLGRFQGGLTVDLGMPGDRAFHYP